MVTVKRSRDVAPRPRLLVLLEPRGAFTAVRENPMAAALVAALLALSLLPPIAFVAKADVAAIVTREMKRSGRTDALSDVQRDAAVSFGAKAMKVALPVGAMSKRAGWIFILAGICFGLLRGAKPELKFAPVLAAVSLASAPLVLYDVVAAVTFIAKDVSTIDAQNPILSNPAGWLQWDTAHNPAATALKGLDFFELWSCALVGMGVNVVAQTKSSMPWLAAFGAHAATVAVAVIGATF